MSFNPNTTNAREWAEEFCRCRDEFKNRHGFTYPETPDSMECWFSSAILSGMRQGTESANSIWLKRERAE